MLREKTLKTDQFVTLIPDIILCFRSEDLSLPNEIRSIKKAKRSAGDNVCLQVCLFAQDNDCG